MGWGEKVKMEKQSHSGSYPGRVMLLSRVSKNQSLIAHATVCLDLVGIIGDPGMSSQFSGCEECFSKLKIIYTYLKYISLLHKI